MTHVTVFGAYGRTGRFVVDELVRRGLTPILSGRDPTRLAQVGAETGLEVRPASVESARDLDVALDGAQAVIGCAGPFAVTAAPLIEAALRARIPVLDIAAEVEVVAETFTRFAGAAVAVVPAMAFYGGLGDLLATAAAGDWQELDSLDLAFALDSWIPTEGTRATIATSSRRRAGKRLALANGNLELRDDKAPVGEWDYPPPFGRQAVVAEFLTADSVTIPRHLRTGALRTMMTLAPLSDLAKAGAPDGDQTFLVEAVARRAGSERRAVVRGRDIYATSAALVAEATRRILDLPDTGVLAAGQIFDARDFLEIEC